MLLPGCWGVHTVNKGENVRVRKSLSWASVRLGSSAREPGGFKRFISRNTLARSAVRRPHAHAC